MAKHCLGKGAVIQIHTALNVKIPWKSTFLGPPHRLSTIWAGRIATLWIQLGPGEQLKLQYKLYQSPELQRRRISTQDMRVQSTFTLTTRSWTATYGLMLMPRLRQVFMWSLQVVFPLHTHIHSLWPHVLLFCHAWVSPPLLLWLWSMLWECSAGRAGCKCDRGDNDSCHYPPFLSSSSGCVSLPVLRIGESVQ
jgi:hypothetical protein